MRTILVTGGAGFVGSHLALALKREHAGVRVVSFDNLSRRGSALNLPRLAAGGVDFVHGDVRCRQDLEGVGKFETLIECSAEPSVLAGYDGSPDYLIQTNLTGATHCLEVSRRYDAGFVFLSTSRVYPSGLIDALAVHETATRYELAPAQSSPGVSDAGFSEAFPLTAPRSLYGATKLAAELLVLEYADAYGMPAVINRCGVIAGPWQMGKVDQGFLVFWVASHLFGSELTYLGYGGSGKQVRDLMHVDDLAALVKSQVSVLGELRGDVFNVGGGRACSVSLRELTDLCREETGQTVRVTGRPDTRRHDIRIYLSDTRHVSQRFGWSPRATPREIVRDVVRWMNDHRTALAPILHPSRPA